MSQGLFDSYTAAGTGETFLLAPPSAVYNSLTKGTIAFWVYLMALPTGTDTTAFIVKDALDAAYPTNLILYQDGGNVFLEGAIVDSLGNKGTSDSSIPMTTGSWIHILMTYDFTGDKVPHLYLNGVETSYSAQTPVITSAPFNDSAGGWYIGNDTFDDGVSGLMAEVGIWNRVLTQPEITAVAASTTGLSGIAAANLVAYWHLRGNTIDAPDSSGNGNTAVNNGTLAAFTVFQGEDSPGFKFPAIPVPTLTVTASDNFIRANEEPLNPTNWDKGTFNIPLAVVSDKAVGNSGSKNGAEWWIGTVLPNDHFSSATLAGATLQEVDTLVRMTSAYTEGYDFYYYRGWVGGTLSNDGAAFIPAVGGTGILLAPLYVPLAPAAIGDVLTTAAVGNDIYLIFNNKVLIKVTDSATPSGGLAGMYISAQAAQIDTSVSLFQTGGAAAPSSFKFPAASIETRQFTTTRPYPGFGPTIH